MQGTRLFFVGGRNNHTLFNKKEKYARGGENNGTFFSSPHSTPVLSPIIGRSNVKEPVTFTVGSVDLPHN